LVLGSVGLGFFWLSMQRPPSWLASLELATGALCCCIAGWVAGSTWTKACWTPAMERQVRTWRRIVDTMFARVDMGAFAIDPANYLSCPFLLLFVTGYYWAGFGTLYQEYQGRLRWLRESGLELKTVPR